MSKNSRKYLERQNRICFDPDTEDRTRADLRSTERPNEDLKAERSAGHRGLLDENKS